MTRKSLLHAIKLKLDIDSEKEELVLLRDNEESRSGNIRPRNRSETQNHNRKYCQRQAYNLAITLGILIETGKYHGLLEITPSALEKIREYEQTNEKPNFKTCIEYGVRNYYSRKKHRQA